MSEEIVADQNQRQSLKESGVDPDLLQTVLTSLTADVKKLGNKQSKGKRLIKGLIVLLVLSILATVILVIEYVHYKNEVIPSPEPAVPFVLDQDSLNMNNA